VKTKKSMQQILPLPKSGFSKENPFQTPRLDINGPPSSRSIMFDESPPNAVGPNTEELQNIKNMILTLQLDLEEERCKRECLEVRLSEFEGSPLRQSHKIQERKWRLSDMQGMNEEIPQNQSFLPAPNTINDVE
jgi:hypothetical protein